MGKNKIILIFLWISILSITTSNIYPIEGGLVVNLDKGTQYNSISMAVYEASSGDTIIVYQGTYFEHIVINKSIRLIGDGLPTIDGGGRGTILTIESTSNVTISGFRFTRSGDSYSTEDSGIKVIDSSFVWIINNSIEEVFFGILPKNSSNIWIINNTIRGIIDAPLTKRQHAIYSWYTFNLYVIGNKFSHVRDGTYNDHVYNAVVSGNYIENARYGVHLMYCENFTIYDNFITGSIAGMALMYSKGIHAYNNTVYMNRVGGIGEGLFIPESDDVIIEDNIIIGNVMGINIRKLPYTPGSYAIIRDNIIAFNYIGVSVDYESATVIYNNSFIENIMDVRLLGRTYGDISWFNESIGVGNYWSNYRGIDGDGDGIGDREHIVQDILEDFFDQHKELRIFIYSPAYYLLEVFKKSFMVNPRIKALDPYPLIFSPHLQGFSLRINYDNIYLPLTLTMTSILIFYYFRRLSR